MKATAVAPSNIAFIKYWGRKDEILRLPENGSISMNLSNLTTTTTIEFSKSFKKDEIIKPLLPSPDVEYKDINANLNRRGGDRRLIPDNVLAQYSDKNLVEYTENFFTLFLKEYAVLIENNFIGLENRFQLYKSLPVLIHCQIIPNRGWTLHYGIKQQDRNEVIVELNSPINLWNGKTKEYLTVHGMRIESILWNSDAVSLDRNLSFEKAKDSCVLRNFIYKWIKKEMEKIFD